MSWADTLSANHRPFVFNHLAGVVGSPLATLPVVVSIFVYPCAKTGLFGPVGASGTGFVVAAVFSGFVIGYALAPWLERGQLIRSSGAAAKA